MIGEGQTTRINEMQFSTVVSFTALTMRYENSTAVFHTHAQVQKSAAPAIALYKIVWVFFDRGRITGAFGWDRLWP